MDVGQECSWFLEDRNPWTLKAGHLLRAKTMPWTLESRDLLTLPQVLPSQGFSGQALMPSLQEMLNQDISPNPYPALCLHALIPDLNPTFSSKQSPSEGPRLCPGSVDTPTQAFSPKSSCHPLHHITLSWQPADNLQRLGVCFTPKMAQSSEQSRPDATRGLCQEWASLQLIVPG